MVSFPCSFRSLHHNHHENTSFINFNPAKSLYLIISNLQVKVVTFCRPVTVFLLFRRGFSLWEWFERATFAFPLRFLRGDDPGLGSGTFFFRLRGRADGASEAFFTASPWAPARSHWRLHDIGQKTWIKTTSELRAIILQHMYIQTGRQAGRQADRQTDRQTYVHTYIHTYIRIDSYIRTYVRTRTYVMHACIFVHAICTTYG